jgi:uncharacterized protein GlcG (DUF336 family)
MKLHQTFQLLTCLLSLAMINQLFAQEMKSNITFTLAQKIIAGSVAYADSSKLSMAIAIYDNHGQLICFAKMDGTSVSVAKVAQWKGLSASVYQFSTEETGKWNVPTAPDMATVPGGLVIKTKDGFVIGAIGVSGSSASVDVKCAEAGLKAAGLFYPAKQ